MGGSYDDEANCIQQTKEGGYIIAGITNSNDGDVSGLHETAGATGNSGTIPDYWVVKINDTGNVQWQKTMGSSYIDMANSIQQTTDGGYIIAGSVADQKANDDDVTGFHLNISLPNASGFDYWIVKLAPDMVTPVKLISFEAIANTCDSVTLNWETAQEINNKGFDVEQSTDGRSFYKISFIAGKGISSNEQLYNFACNNLISGQNYFRLKQIDLDGQFEYSSIVTINSNCTNQSITVFPNPATNSVHISGLPNTPYTIKLINAAGTSVGNWSNTIKRDFDLSILPNGIYFFIIGKNSFKVSKE